MIILRCKNNYFILSSLLYGKLFWSTTYFIPLLEFPSKTRFVDWAAFEITFHNFTQSVFNLPFIKGIFKKKQNTYVSFIIISLAFQWLSRDRQTIETLIPLINRRDRAAISFLPFRFVETSLPEPPRYFLSLKMNNRTDPRRGETYSPSGFKREFLSYASDRLTQIPVTVKGVRQKGAYSRDSTADFSSTIE